MICKVSSEKFSNLKLVLKDREGTKKELELTFLRNEVFKGARLEKSLLSYSGISFFPRYIPHAKF